MSSAYRDDLDAAFHWLDRAYELHDTGLVFVDMHPYMSKVRSDPRYPAFKKKIGLTS
jgi:hypothetical protein